MYELGAKLSTFESNSFTQNVPVSCPTGLTNWLTLYVYLTEGWKKATNYDFECKYGEAILISLWNQQCNKFIEKKKQKLDLFNTIYRFFWSRTFLNL